MAGRYLATELQNENGDVIYPHTEADIVFASDGTTVEENLGGEVTDADIQEIFGDSQVEAGKKLSVKEKIKKALKRYQTLLAMKVLDTVEEVEANTDAGYLMGAKAGAELINDLTALNDGGAIKGLDAREDGVYITYVPSSGADAVTKKLGSSAELLWTNPSVNADSQIIIPCNWYKYDKIIILACQYVGRTNARYIQCCDIGTNVKGWYLSDKDYVVYREIEFIEGNILMSTETVHNSQSYNIPLKIWGMNTETDMFSYP